MFRLRTFALQLFFGIGLLALLWWFVDEEQVINQLQNVSYPWLFFALVAALPQIFLSAYRWQKIAQWLGFSLPYKIALKEYYLSFFLNQLLPSGLGGDVIRTFRMIKSPTDTVNSPHTSAKEMIIQSVILDKFYGYAILLPFAMIALGMLAWTLPKIGSAIIFQLGLPIAIALGIALVVLLAVAINQKFWKNTHIARFWVVGRAAFRQKKIFIPLFTISFVLFLFYLVMFYCAGRFVGVDISLFMIFAATPILLLSMSVPVSIAGWGIRESLAVTLWLLTGNPGSEGLIVSLAYGLVVLLASIPGAFFVIRRS